MEHYAGIDVSLEQSSVCVVDGTGRIVREAKVASEPEALVRFFGQLGLVVTRIGLEAGPLSQWLHAGLTKAGLDAVLLKTRQVKAALSAMVVNKDKKDARGIAQLLRHGLVPAGALQVAAGAGGASAAGRPQALAVQAPGRRAFIWGIILPPGFGLKVGIVAGKGRFAMRIRELVTGQPMLERVIEPMLRAREALRAEYSRVAPGRVGRGPRGHDLPSADDSARGPCSGRDHIHLGDRRSGPVCTIPGGRRALRPGSEEVPVTDVTGGIGKVGGARRCGVSSMRPPT